MINPQGLLWSDITPGDLVVVDARGRKVSGRHAVEPTVFFIHSAIHRGRTNAACVKRTRMSYAKTLTVPFLLPGMRFEEPSLIGLCLFSSLHAYRVAPAWKARVPRRAVH